MEIGESDSMTTQHKGLGEELLMLAERTAKKRGVQKLAIISGVGVRNYYRKFGYKLAQSYVQKKLTNRS